MNIALCDDEPILLKTLKDQITNIFQNHNITCSISIFLSGEALLESSYHFDIIFLDIKLDGISGMDTANLLRKHNNHSKIIFLTAYKQFVFQAFDVDASHYLLKPVQPEKLELVIMHIVNKIDSHNKSCLSFKSNAATYSIPFYSIYYIEVINRKIFLYTENGIVEFYEKLSSLENRLTKEFFRCHRSYIVNLSQVYRYESNIIYMKNGVQIPLSRRKYADFSISFMENLKTEDTI